MTLCSHRPGGFGPASSSHPAVPTTCFNDVIVVPLATWIYLVALIVLIPITYKSRKIEKQSDKARISLIAQILRALYYILIVAMVAMVSLEIARLVVAQLGIGLLPFTYVGILAAGIVHFFWNILSMRILSSFYWVLLIIAMAIKVAALADEGVDSRHGVQSNYPVSDNITDVSTMMGVSLVLAILELLSK